MEMKCEWCGGTANNGENTVYWELPDGSRAIEITMTPAIICQECGMEYQTDITIKDIEDLLDTKPKKKNQNNFSSIILGIPIVP
ncbi:YokU family protein [Bacillus marasmi]|uniref:YokU family protein n=1 Tax=Bacillus marasmi TaxID=1926279 RepID=UPI0011CABE6E